jgi:hypothetical protein
MELYTQQLEKYLKKNYFITTQHASGIIEDEYEFIEECHNAQMSIAKLAQELIEIYMVA